jgi:hypothetical protein
MSGVTTKAPTRTSIWEISGWREALDEIEQSFAPRGNVSAVLDVVQRPKFLRPSVIALVKQRVEPFENKPFVFLTRIVH